MLGKTPPPFPASLLNGMHHMSQIKALIDLTAWWFSAFHLRLCGFFLISTFILKSAHLYFSWIKGTSYGKKWILFFFCRAGLLSEKHPEKHGVHLSPREELHHQQSHPQPLPVLSVTEVPGSRHVEGMWVKTPAYTGSCS